MRVLITGAAGFVGRHLTALCTREGAEVTGLGRYPKGDVAGAYEQVDLGDAEGTRAAVARIRPERVFHLAADASVARSWESPGEVMENNVRSTLNLLRALCDEAPDGSALVACSGEEYGPVPGDRLPVTEEEPLRPQNPYAVSKAMADLLAGFYADAHGLRVVRARSFNHAGPGQSDVYVVSSFARQVAEAEAAAPSDGRVAIATGNPESRRDFTDVRDVVRAYWVALERAEAGAYNVCSGRSTAVADILAGLSEHTALRLERHTDPARLRGHEVMEIRGSHDKLTDATGWQPEIELRATLRDTLDWWRERVAAGVAR